MSCVSPGDGGSVQRFDEDGVEVVYSLRPQWTEGGGWRLTDEPEVSIGENTDDPRYLFSAIYGGRFLGAGTGLGPFRLPDGKIVAGDVRSVEVRIFNESGLFVRAVVGQGEGPTELTSLRQLHHCIPGFLFAIDGDRDLLAVIDATGQFHGRLFFEENAGTSFYSAISCNRSGQLLGMDWGTAVGESRQENLGFHRTRAHLWLLDQEGFVLRDLGEFPGVERLGNPRGSTPHPFGKATQHALDADRAYVGTADDFEIEVWLFDGTLQRRLRRPMDNATVTDSDVDFYLSPDAPDPEIAENLELLQQMFTPLPLPETYPAYTRFVLDATDHLWVEHSRTPRRQRHLWSVFDPEGVWLGEVEVPPTFEITDIGEDYVLGVFRDELDEQSIRSYGLLR